MKLVEILARELKAWPEESVLVQSHSGLVYETGGQGKMLGYYTTASDWTLAEVNLDQWEAERARIAMDGISAFSQEQANAEAEKDQELWDAVYSEIFFERAAHVGSDSTKSTWGMIAEISSRAADAFMAERAKRLKQ